MGSIFNNGHSFYFPADVWALIQQYYQTVCRNRRHPPKDLFEYIIGVYSESNQDSDTEEEEEEEGEVAESLEVKAKREVKDSPDYAEDTP